MITLQRVHVAALRWMGVKSLIILMGYITYYLFSLCRLRRSIFSFDKIDFMAMSFPKGVSLSLS